MSCDQRRAITQRRKTASDCASRDVYDNVNLRSTEFTVAWLDKKDGYRQQNVRQRQKLISIIDYDVCILE